MAKEISDLAMRLIEFGEGLDSQEFICALAVALAASIASISGTEVQMELLLGEVEKNAGQICRSIFNANKGRMQ